MKNFQLKGIPSIVIALILALSACAYGAILPTPDGGRALRPETVKTWYIYQENPANPDGILNPGDVLIDTFENWWTPVSSHSQHNISLDHGGGQFYHPDDDIGSAPMSAASTTNPADNVWLPKAKNAINFYMTYAQYDNQDWVGGYTDGLGGNTLGVVSDRHAFRNGYALGWVTHEKEPNNSNPQTPAGFVEMDIFVHHGRGLDDSTVVNVPGWGLSFSNPQISMSNDISSLARDYVGSTGGYHPPQFDEGTQTYSWGANSLRMTANGLTPADLATIINSMEVGEYDPTALGNPEVIVDNQHPNAIAATLTDHTGIDPYMYLDSYLERSAYHDGATDGGVIAGLAGQEDYVFDPNQGINTWGDQQVIRVDFSPDTFAAGNITKIVIWDFSDQLNPVPIVLDLYDPGTGQFLYPEGRFYIALVHMVPEPLSATLLVLGGMVLVVRRRKRR